MDAGTHLLVGPSQACVGIRSGEMPEMIHRLEVAQNKLIINKELSDLLTRMFLNQHVLFNPVR